MNGSDGLVMAAGRAGQARVMLKSLGETADSDTRSSAPLIRGGPRKSGVIDTISAGYAAINRQPWLLLAPILLDLLLWLGPRVSPAG